MKKDITKQWFACALQHLLETKPLDNIAVSDICNEAGLSKKCFYYHFKDKYDCAKWCYNSIASMIQAEDITKDYLTDLENGNLRFNHADFDGIEVPLKNHRFWYKRSELSAFGKNLLTNSKDIQSPYNIRRKAAAQGKRKILKRMLDERNLVMDDVTVDIGVSMLCYLADLFYDRWGVLYSNQTELPRSESEQLIKLTTAFLDFWVGLGKPCADSQVK